MKIQNKILALIFVGVVFIFAAVPVKAADTVLPGFNPNKIVEDFVFSNTKAFSNADAIQKFLESKNSVLASSDPSFIAKLREPAVNALKETLDDPRPNLSRNRTAAELIWDASQSSGLNAQVILVTLNKEQSLITGHQNSSPERLQRALDFAMGFGCPDSQPCGETYRGFYAQLFGGVDAENNRYLGSAKSLFRSFSTPGGRGPAFNGSIAKIGDTITLDNTLGDYEGVMPRQTVTIGNAATAALYRYTPHVFNGNYNFWKLFNAWFRYNDGVLLKQKSKSAKLYMLLGGTRYEVLPFVAEARNLKTEDAIVVSKSEINSYPLAKEPLGLPDNTLVKQGDKLFMFINNERRPVLEFVARIRGLTEQKIFNLSQSEARSFKVGDPLPPSDGVLLKTQSDPAIYLIVNGKLRLFTAFTYKQQGTAKNIELVQDDELKTLTKDGYVYPLEGTLLKAAGSPAVFVFESGQLKQLSGEAFGARGYKFNQVTEVPQSELDLYPVGPAVTAATPLPATTPPAGSYNPAIKEGAIIKAKGSTVIYVIEGGQKKALSYEVFVARGYKFKNVIELPAKDVNAYPTGSPAAAKPTTAVSPVAPPAKLPPNMTYFSNKKTGEFYVFMNGVKRIIFSFVAKQKSMTPDISYEDAYVKSLPSGDPVAPRDGTVMKGDKNATIYIVEKALLRPVTATAYANRNITTSQIKAQPQAEIDAYAKGQPLLK